MCRVLEACSWSVFEMIWFVWSFSVIFSNAQLYLLFLFEIFFLINCKKINMINCKFQMYLLIVPKRCTSLIVGWHFVDLWVKSGFDSSSTEICTRAAFHSPKKWRWVWMVSLLALHVQVYPTLRAHSHW